MQNLKEKSYNQVLQETSDYFKSQGINIIGEGYREIATNEKLLETYISSLTEGATADQAVIMGQLMANTNAGILRESSMSGIQPIASLSMPVIRKLWPKFALKDALKTEVAKTPRFVISYTKPYMFTGTTPEVHFSPRDLKTQMNSNVTGQTFVYPSATSPVGSAEGTTLINASDMVEGQRYEIAVVAQTNWTAAGASASTIGTTFTAANLAGVITTIDTSPVNVTAVTAADLGKAFKVIAVGDCSNWEAMGADDAAPDIGDIFVSTGVTGINAGTASTIVKLGQVYGETVQGITSSHYIVIDGGSGLINASFETDLTTPSNTKHQELDDIMVTSIQLIKETKTYTLKVPKHNIDVTNSIFLDFSQEVTGELTVSPFTADGATSTIAGKLIVRADLKAATAMVAAIEFTIEGVAAEEVIIALKAAVTNEWNEATYSVGFDIARKDINIPTGQHINAPLPIEALNDMMALYQIDGTKEAVDLMTNILAMRLDLEVLEFLETSYLNQPGVAEFYDYPEAADYLVSFDVRPSAGFAGSPKAWREEIKPQIDWLSQKIKNETYLQSGVFTIVGNPLDIQIISNIDWKFHGGQGANMDGVDVDYSIGTYMGTNAYRVISSVNVTQGYMYLIFTPSSDTQMTYKYYPYTFSTEQGYIDPNRSRVPSIMMTKRHAFAEFLPAIGMIRIYHNDGTSQFNPGYTVIDGTNTWNV